MNQTEFSLVKEDKKDKLMKKNMIFNKNLELNMVICGARILYLEGQELVNLNSFVEI